MPKKQHRGGQPNPAIRLSSLGPRLTQLFAHGDPTAMGGELDRLTDGLKPSSFLPLVVGALASTPDPQREQLIAPVSAWLKQRELQEPLSSLQARYAFQGPADGVARALLAATGIAVAPEEEADPVELFIAAYELGEPSQDAPTLFWYEDARRRRVLMASLLVDFEPPWEGALKDLAFSTYRDHNRALDEYLRLWRGRGMEPRALDAATAAQRVWRALRQNQAQQIRLPSDFVAVMPRLLPFLLALPVASDATPLSADELAALATTGRNPEQIRREERLFGYQTRMEDGSVVRLMRPLDDDEL